MSKSTIHFSDTDKIGTVLSVDSSRVTIDVTNTDLLTRLSIGNLVAIQGRTTREYLIAIIEKATRGFTEGIANTIHEDEDELQQTIIPSDLVRGALIGTFRTVDGDRSNTFKRGADSFPQIDKCCYVIENNNLQIFMNILGTEHPKEERLKLGSFSLNENTEAIINGDKFFQRHAAILGSTGSGKSYATALLLERAAKLSHPNIIVFDMHGEYTPLAEASSGGFATRFRIAGPSDIDSPSEEVLFLPYWLLNRDEMLSLILDRSDQNAPNQASRFTLHVRELKEETLKNRNSKALKTFTIDSPIPYDIKKLVSLIEIDNSQKGEGSTGRPVKGEWEGKLSRLLSRISSKMEDRRYGFMFSPPKETYEYEWLARQAVKLLSSEGSHGIKIIDFSEVPPDVLPIVTGTLARLLYSIQFWITPEERTPITLLCDEAHLYLPVREDADSIHSQALKSFERISKEGRKYGFSIVVVSQRPSDVSRTILSQCNNIVALRLTNETDQSVIKHLMPDNIAGLANTLPLLDTGESLVLGDSILIPSRIRFDIPKVRPNSATRDFWKEWRNSPSKTKEIELAVEALRSQARVPSS